MPAYTQTENRLRVTTGMGADALLLTGFQGTEGLSQLFRFELDMVAPADAPADFARVLGKPAAIALDLPNGEVRHFHGLVSRFSQGGRDDTFISYRAELVPLLWLLTRRVQSRIFQHQTAKDILATVLAGIPLKWDVRGKLAVRDYCTQYRESDFAFASRLLEDEGIYYYFTHAADGHTLVLSDHPDGHQPVPVEATLEYLDAAAGEQPRDQFVVTAWEKVQEIRTGKVTLWDHQFELPHRHLEAEAAIPKSLTAGTVSHDLGAGESAKLERYEHPGGYGDWFDDVDKGGGATGDLQQLFDQNRRVAGLRAQEEAAGAVRVEGASHCGNLTAGHTFALTRHFDADGEYLLTAVSHAASGGDYRSGGGVFTYQNQFTCVPRAVVFRPARETPRPTVHGTQTAVVVGPAGEEIFTDKYGRVKVQFHWDRAGKNDPDSSCWVRVSSQWAGKGWGMINIPRMGQEVVVDYLEGDPDRPIIVGSVYNADQMPPWALPANRTQSGILTRSSLGGSPANANAIRFEDKKGSEQVWIHAEKNQDIEVEHDETHWVGHDRTKTIDHDETTHVKHDRTETVDNNETITIHANRTETVDKEETITIHGGRTETVDKEEKISIHGGRTETVDKEEKITIGGGRTENVSKDEKITIGGGRTENVGKDEKITIGGGRTESVAKDEKISIGGGRTESVTKDESVSVGGGRQVSVTKDDALSVGKSLAVTATDTITLTVGSASLVMKKDGTITLNGKDVSFVASGEMLAKATKDVTIKGKKILQN